MLSSRPLDNLIDIEFKNVTYKISPGKKDEKTILNEISGYFKSNELTAILGPSGSGKTTLINILSGYKCKKSSGSILINNQPKNSEIFKNISRYIMQEFDFTNELTLQETMMFAAKLKLGKISSKQISNEIDKILIQFRLDTSRGNFVGKLSGGERKRLSIALELINNPSVLFLDEPTTGLDCSSCVQIIHLLKNLVNSGRTVICSLHSPSAQIISNFDNVYILTTTGQCAYQGNYDKIVPYLESLNLICPSHYNPADYIIEIVNGDYGDNYNNKLVSLIKNGKETVNEAFLNNESQSSILTYPKKLLCNLREYESTWIDQFRILFKRMWLQTCRNKVLLALQFVTNIAVGLVLGLLFQGKGTDGAFTFQILALVFTGLVYVVYFHGILILFQFSREWMCINREYFNKWYSLSAYFCASFASKLPFHVMFTTIFVSIFYKLVDLPMELNRFLIILTIYILVGLVGESITYICTVPLKLLQGFFTLMVIMMVLNAMLLQELTYKTELPMWIKFCLGLNFFWYGFKGASSDLYENRKRLECSKFCFYPDLDEFLHNFGTGHVIWWIDIVGLIILLISFKFIGYYLLKKKCA